MLSLLLAALLVPPAAAAKAPGRTRVPEEAPGKRTAAEAPARERTAAEAPAWEHVARTDGVDVYNREVKGLSVDQLKAVGLVDAPPERVLAVIADVERYTETMPHTETARVVRREGASLWLYTVVDPPVVSRRDYCIKLTFSRAPGGVLKAVWAQANELAPRESPGVRVEVAAGHWILTPTDGGRRTRVEYLVHAEPGGKVPAWIANLANTTGVSEVFESLRRAVKLPRYAKARTPLGPP